MSYSTCFIFTDLKHMFYCYWVTPLVVLLLRYNTYCTGTELQHLLYFYWDTPLVVLLLRYNTSQFTQLFVLLLYSHQPATHSQNSEELCGSSFIHIRLADCFMLNWVTVVIGKTVKPVNLKSVLTITMNDNTIFILRVKILCFNADNTKNFAFLQNFWPLLWLIEPPSLWAHSRLSSGYRGRSV